MNSIFNRARQMIRIVELTKVYNQTISRIKKIFVAPQLAAVQIRIINLS